VPSLLTQSTTKLSVKEVMQRESPAIVSIYNLDARGEVRSTGTGFIVMAEGVVITNYHVIEGAHNAQVKLKNGEVYDKVRVLDYDKRRDIAVLQVRATDLPMVMLGESTEAEIGDAVLTIGNPKGLEHTVSTGIISARRTDVKGLDGTMVFQMTAPISPGSSGGPLYNSRGEVIGITTAQFKEGQNLNFAVDFKYAKLMFGQGPGLQITLAELAAKESPAKSQEPSRASNPSSGGSSNAAGEAYTEPTNLVTVTVLPGWKAQPGYDPPNGWILEITRGEMLISVQRRVTDADVESIFRRGEEAVLKTMEQTASASKIVDGVNAENRPFKARFYPTKTKSGKSQLLFLGAVVTSRARLLVIGFLPSSISDAEIDNVSNMFLSLR
jgi:hypothetical protein